MLVFDGLCQFWWVLVFFFLLFSTELGEAFTKPNQGHCLGFEINLKFCRGGKAWPGLIQEARGFGFEEAHIRRLSRVGRSAR